MARGALRPIPPPFPAREGGEGSRIRCGGTGASPIVPPTSTGSPPTSSPVGCARHTRGVSCLPYPPPTHKRRRGWWTGRREGCGVWGGLSGPGPAVRAARESRRGRKAPGRLPGRLLLWASALPRLTSCRQRGKMLDEGSHRRRSLRRPSSMVRQKPGRFRNDRALLYLGHHPRDCRRIKCA